MVNKNFRFLYKYYGDKQDVLAQMFHVTQSNISDYVTGKKKIPTDIIKKISVRYNVPIDDLMNNDLSLEFGAPQTVKLNDAIDFGENLFPILTSSIAKNNSDFNWAYKIMLESLQTDNLDSLDKSIFDLEHAVSIFQKTWKEVKTFVALANSISIILFIYAFYSQQNKNIGQDLLKNGEIKLFDIEQDCLRDPNKPIAGNPYEKQRRNIFEKYDSMVYENIKTLKSHSHFSELGDYYLALCNLLNFDDDFSDYEISYQAGLYMIIQLSKLGNKYADKFIETFPFIS